MKFRVTKGSNAGKTGTSVHETEYARVLLLDSGEEIGVMKDELEPVQLAPAKVGALDKDAIRQAVYDFLKTKEESGPTTAWGSPIGAIRSAVKEAFTEFLIYNRQEIIAAMAAARQP